MRPTARALVLVAALCIGASAAVAGPDLTQPSHSVVGRLEVSKDAGLGRIELHGKVAAALQRDEGIVALIDISKPSAPKVLGRYDDDARQSLDGDLAFSSDGKWLFYARQTVQFSKDGVHVLDVSDPSAPSLASYQPGGGTLRIAYHDDGSAEWVVVMDAMGGLVVYRFEPTSGVLVPVHVSPLPALKVGGPASAGLAIEKDPALGKTLLYATTGQTGLEIFDFSDPTDPSLLGSWPDMGLAEVEVQATGKKRLVYGAAEYWFDKTSRPIVVELDATKLGAIKKKRMLSVGCKTDDTQRVQGMALSGDHLYVANSSAGLPVFFGDNLFRFTPMATGPQNPESGYQGSPYVFDVETKGSFVYASDAASGYLTVIKRDSVKGWDYSPDELEWHTEQWWDKLDC